MLKTIYPITKNILNNGRSVSLLLGRLVVAYGFYEPAIQKWSDISSVASWFGSLGIPFPTLNAYMAASTEILGVALLTLGLFTRLISLPLMVVMVVAIMTVHLAHGKGLTMKKTFQLGLLLIGALALSLTLATAEGKCGTSQQGMMNNDGRCGDSQKGTKRNDGRCGDSQRGMKSGDGRCGDSQKGTKRGDGRCGDSQKGTKRNDGRCGDSQRGMKSGDGRCGADGERRKEKKPAPAKGKCGQGKCG